MGASERTIQSTALTMAVALAMTAFLPAAAAQWPPPIVKELQERAQNVDQEVRNFREGYVCPHVTGTWGYPRAMVPLPGLGCSAPWCESAEALYIGVLCFAETADGNVRFCEVYVPFVDWTWTPVPGVTLHLRCINVVGDTTYVGGTCVPGRIIQVMCNRNAATPENYQHVQQCIVWTAWACFAYVPPACASDVDALCWDPTDSTKFCYAYVKSQGACVGPLENEPAQPIECSQDVEVACWADPAAQHFCIVWVNSLRRCVNPIYDLFPPNEDQ